MPTTRRIWARNRSRRAALAAGCLCATQLSIGCVPETREFTPVAEVKDVMLSVLEPAAETYWDAVGWILDEDGVHEIYPRSDEEWETVHNAAFVIAESGNLLMMKGRALDSGPWMGHARELIDTGTKALRAAETRDIQGVFDAGAEVYYACSNCHAAYAPETLRPADARAVAAGDDEPGSESAGPGESGEPDAPGPG